MGAAALAAGPSVYNLRGTITNELIKNKYSHICGTIKECQFYRLRPKGPSECYAFAESFSSVREKIYSHDIPYDEHNAD